MPLSKIKQFLSHPLVRFSLAASLLFLVFRQVDVKEIWFKLQAAHPAGWIVFLLGNVALAWLASWRWSLLTLAERVRPAQVWPFFQATMVGLFYNLFMPSSMGGDVLKWTKLTHLPVSKGKLIFSMLLDRVMGMMGLATLGFLALVLAEYTNAATVPPSLWWFFSALFIGVLVFFGLVFSRIQWQQLPWVGKWKQVAEMERYLELHRDRFLLTFGIAIVIQLIGALLEYALAVAVGFHMPWPQFMVLAPILGVIISLPLNFAGFGATEAGFVFFFSQYGESTSTILALTSLMAVMRFILGGIGWLLSLIKKSN
jgi:uncharacterized protein (TIRG00374 family)